MPLAEHGRGGDVLRLRLLDGFLHREFVDHIAEAPVTVDHGGGRAFLYDIDGCAGDDMLHLDPVDIGRDLDDAV